MAYLHCHNCDFSQDDFWKESYNPLQFLKYAWVNKLLSANLDDKFTTDSNFIKENGDITIRELLAKECEWAAEKIRKMVYRTDKEYREKNPNRICPICKQKTLDID
jgi:hypothetical protein